VLHVEAAFQAVEVVDQQKAYRQGGERAAERDHEYFG